ncbi:MAG: VOC family protein [Ktedonobacteraceae bacterium]|nr:VOC family protein [Ktedonobacteraceae bacterium]
MFQIASFDHLALTVRDRERSTDWYQKVFGMERRYQDVWTGLKNPVVLCTGSVCVALFQAGSAEPLRPRGQGQNHFALKVDRANFEKAQEELRQHGIQFKFWDHQICHSLYLFDRDSYEIELTTYELPAQGLSKKVRDVP